VSSQLASSNQQTDKWQNTFHSFLLVNDRALNSGRETGEALNCIEIKWLDTNLT
jgi:hypothetical protein